MPRSGQNLLHLSVTGYKIDLIRSPILPPTSRPENTSVTEDGSSHNFGRFARDLSQVFPRNTVALA